MNAGRVVGARGFIAAASLALCLGGIGTVTSGVAVPVQAQIAQHRLEQVFEQRLAANTVQARPALRATGQRPTTPAMKEPSLPTTGPVARLTVDRLGIRETILAGSASHEQLARGPTMLKAGDAMSPVTVLAAHRDTHFLFIRDLRQGDEVVMQLVTGEVARYRVTHLETVRWDQFVYPLDPARPLMALTTCYPFGGTEYGGPLRRVAWAAQIS